MEIVAITEILSQYFANVSFKALLLLFTFCGLKYVIEYDRFGQSAVHLHLQAAKRHREQGIWRMDCEAVMGVFYQVWKVWWTRTIGIFFVSGCGEIEWICSHEYTPFPFPSLGSSRRVKNLLNTWKSGNLLSELYIYIMESTATCLALWGTYTKGRTRSRCFASVANGALSSFILICYVLWQVGIRTLVIIIIVFLGN